MLPPKRSLPTFALLVAASLVATEAHAQQYRPDAEAYPCASHEPLTVMQDGQGFSIRPAKGPVPAKSPAKPPIDFAVAIGGALKLDRDIFTIIPRHEEGKTDARHR